MYIKEPVHRYTMYNRLIYSNDDDDQVYLYNMHRYQYSLAALALPKSRRKKKRNCRRRIHAHNIDQSFNYQIVFTRTFRKPSRPRWFNPETRRSSRSCNKFRMECSDRKRLLTRWWRHVSASKIKWNRSDQKGTRIESLSPFFFFCC